MKADNLLEVKNHSIYFQSQKRIFSILDRVSFTLKKGEILGVVGESGCGKTMLGNSIIGLYPPNVSKIEGEIHFNDTELISLSAKERSKYRGKHISMLFQNPNTSLNPVFTIGKQMTDIICKHKKITKAKAKEEVVMWLKEVSLPDPERVFKSYPHQLSGGMKQRVVIAMAISCHAELVIADEPTTALDVTTQFQILELLQKLQKEYNISIMLVTHDMGVAAYICNQIMVMYGGHVIEVGPTEEILNSPHHPYTKGLLQCLPKKGKKVEDLYTIPGSVPSPLDFPKGCRFATRCPRAVPLCESEKPPLNPRPLNPNRYVACFYPEEGVSSE